MKRRIFLSIGSNIEPERHVPACIETLQKKFSVLKVSSIYETDPVGTPGAEKFWNAAAEIETDFDAEKLSAELRGIEMSLGRRRIPGNKFAPRTIDIDVLPQPGFQKQGFVMIPLAEIAPEEKDSETGRTFSELASALAGKKEKCRKVR